MEASQKFFFILAKKGYFALLNYPTWFLKQTEFSSKSVHFSSLLIFFFFRQQFPLNHAIPVEGKWEQVCTQILHKDRKVYL